MPSVMVWVISWATLLFLSLEATRYSEAILALSWALLALLSAILPRSSKYVLLIVVVATLSTPPSVVVASSSKYLPTMHPAQLNIRGQLRRIPLPRTWVNKRKKRGRGCYGPGRTSTWTALDDGGSSRCGGAYLVARAEADKPDQECHQR